MANKKGKINLNYNLKDKSEELTLVYLIGYCKKRFKISTKQNVYVKTWNVEKQRCTISSDFSDRINRVSRKVNKFLDALDDGIKMEKIRVYMEHHKEEVFTHLYHLTNLPKWQ